MGNEFKSISSQDGSCGVDVGEYAGDYKIRFKVGGIERGTIDDNGLFEIDNIKCRGSIQTVSYEVNTVSVMGGAFVVGRGDTLASDMTSLDSETMTTQGNDSFAANDRLQISDGVNNEHFIVTDASSHPTYVVTRDAGCTYGTDANPAWTKGASVINYGAPGEGVVWLTASDNNAPFVSVWTHEGSPWSDAAEKCRFGNLNGYLGYSTDTYGVGIGSIATNEASLTFDPTNGIRIRQGATNIFTLDMSGNSNLSGLTVGAPTESEEGLYAGAGITRVQMKAGVGIWTGATLFADAKIGLSIDGSGKIASGNFIWDTSGNVTMSGSFTSSATITGGTIQTAASGARSVLSSTGLAVYDTTTQRAKIGSDGAGWFGASDRIAWTSTGVLTVGGWIVGGDYLQSASSGARIVLNQDQLRVSIFDASNEKVVMGYLENLIRNNGTGTATAGSSLTLTDTSQDWQTNEHSDLKVFITGGTGSGQNRTISSNTETVLTVSTSWGTIPNATSIYEIRYTVADYGFWARAGDALNIDGDVLYSSGDWIIQHDSSYLVQDSSGNTIIRLGTDSGEKGLFVYDSTGAQLAKLISTGLEMFGNGQQRVEIANDGTGWIGTNSGITWDAAGNISMSGVLTVEENNVLTIAQPGGASFSSSSYTLTGVIKINLPQSWTNTMMKFIVAIFDYSDGISFFLELAGYNCLNSTSWNRPTANLSGSTAANNRVRFGHDGTKCCICIGETTSVWYHLKATVRDFQAGLNNYSKDQWDDGWSISVVSDLSGCTFTKDIADSLIDAQSIVNQGELATIDNSLDNINDGTYGKVLSTAISAGKIVLTSAGVTGTLPTSLTIAKCTDANADQTSTHGQNLGWLIGSTGTLTISSTGKLSINTADALEITASGNIKVLAGGDINMYSSSSNPSKIKFYGTTGGLVGGLYATASNKIGLFPDGTGEWLLMGDTSNLWEGIDMKARSVFSYGYYDLDDFSRISQYGENNASYLLFRVNRNGTNRYVYFTGSTFYPNPHKTLYLGTSTYAWDSAYADDWINVADFYNFDAHDDLATLHQIKGSGLVEEHNGYEIIDDDTLPAWLLCKHKKDGEDINEETQEIIKTWKKGDTMYDPDGKPYLSLKTCISLAWGAIRQLDKKFETKINGG